MRSCVGWVCLSAAVIVAGCARERASISADDANEPVQTVEEHWPDGKLKSRVHVIPSADGTFVNQGTYMAWHNNGKLAYEATYVHGKLNGIETAWHKNGRKWTETHYVNGVRDGARYSWFENGQMSKEEHWTKGKPSGTWTVWKENGEVEVRQTFGEPRSAP